MHTRLYETATAGRAGSDRFCGGDGSWIMASFERATVAYVLRGQNTRVAASASSAPYTRDAASARPIALWLLTCCALIAIMVLLGGVTRLKHAGLSIVEWQPLTGVLPPLSAPAWEDAFAQYQRYPEFQKLNRGMTLGEFKSIYWLEYLHRLWGRFIGIAFLVPCLYFALRRRIGRALIPKLAMLFALGGLQGALGWYMVKSGLVDRPDVSQYRLSAHLGLAALIYQKRSELGVRAKTARYDTSYYFDPELHA